jgi:hypothetical protein
MTTIFADAQTGVMVCDSKCTEGGIWYPMGKVQRHGDELIGIAGNVKEACAWLKWYTGGKKGARPKMESFAAMILRESGLYAVSEDAFEMLIERGYHGVGSGGGCAVSAFKAGADPERAVHIACEVDANSGGDIVVHTLKS